MVRAVERDLSSVRFAKVRAVPKVRAGWIQLATTIVFAALLTGALKAAPTLFPGVCQTLVVASSDEKFSMLRYQLAAPYNAEGHFVDGRCARVDIEHVNSGDAEQLLENGWRGTDLQRPDVWSPASSAWIALLQDRSKSGAALIPHNYESLFQSPTVIAMPAPMAEALGYPGRTLGWSDIFSLVNNPAGWGSVGMPQWGKFKLAKTNPTISTSGLHALIGTYDAAGAETVAEVQSRPAREFVGKIESSVVHYAPTAGTFLGDLTDADSNGKALDFMSAVVIEEQEMVSYNATSPAPRTPLVAIYPKEGTLVDDHPYVLLSWSAMGNVAEDFYRYASAHSGVIDANFFRDRSGNALSKLSSQRGISVGLPARLAPPSGAVVDAMLSQWEMLRRRARVLIVVDAGAGNAALAAAHELGSAVAGFQSTDEVGVWVFPQSAGSSSGYTVLRPLSPDDSSLGRTLTNVQAVPHRGDLDQVVTAAVSSMSMTYSPDSIDAVLVIEMEPGARTPADEQLETALRNQPADRFVRIFTVGPSSDRLLALARAGRGAAYQPGGATHFLNDVIGSF